MEERFDVHAVLVGKPSRLQDGENHEVESAINKRMVTEPVFLSKLNFDGDRQADQKNHGGYDKAVLGYSFDHYPFWEKILSRPLDPGAFGENLSIKGLTEHDTRIGDVFQLDEAVVQVSQPRLPCFKLAFKHREKKLPLWVEETGKSGIYFRVLEEGWVSPHPILKRLSSGSSTLSLGDVIHYLFKEKDNVQALRSIIAIPELASSLKGNLEKKLSRLI